MKSAIASLLKENATLAILIFLTAGLALHRGGISFQAHLLLGLTLLPLWCATVFFNKKPKTETAHPDLQNKGMPIWIAITILLLLWTIIAGWSHARNSDFGFIAVSGSLSGLAILLIIWQWNPDKEDMQKFFSWLYLIAIGFSTFGLTLYVLTPIDRNSGPFVHLPWLTTGYPNALALFLLALIPHILKTHQGNSDQKKLNLSSLNLAIIITSLWLTFSRAALLIGIIILAIALIQKIISWKKLIAPIVIAILLTTAIQNIRSYVFPTPTFTEKLTFTAGEKTASISERKNFWLSGIDMLKKSPLYGIGPDNFRLVYPPYEKSPLTLSDHPHNIFLKQSLDYGIPSAILLLILIGISLFLAWKNRKEKPYIFLIGLSVMSITLHDLLDYNLNFTANLTLLWISIGCIFVLVYKDTEYKNATKNKYAFMPLRAQNILTGLLIIILFIGSSYETFQRRTITKQRSDSKIYATHSLFPEEDSLLKIDDLLNANMQKEAITSLDEILRKNPDFAEAYERKTAILMMEKNWPAAFHAIDKAMSLNINNDLSGYATRMMIKKQVGAKITEKEKQDIKNIISNYTKLLTVNAHNTVRSTNPKSVIQIASLLEEMMQIDTPEAKREQLAIRRLRTKLTQVAITERQKFFEKFLIPLDPL